MIGLPDNIENMGIPLSKWEGTINELIERKDLYPVVVLVHRGMCWKYYLLYEKKHWEQLEKVFFSNVFYFRDKKDIKKLGFRFPLEVQCPFCSSSNPNTNRYHTCKECGRGFIV